MTSQNAADQPVALNDEPNDLTYFAFAENAARSAPPQAPEGLSEMAEILGSRYKLERLLGVGGMGVVYRARDLLREQFGDPDPYIALKTVSDDFAEYPDANALLFSEFALTSRLQHANVVRVFNFDVDISSKRAFIILELLKGPTLDQLLCDKPHGLPWDELRSIAIPLIEALHYSHQKGVLHGDIKPSNVLLADDGLRLFDYGLGQPMEGLLTGLPRLSRTRFNAWTPRYAALELINGESLTPAADIYALACVLLELSNGKHPFQRLSARQAMNIKLDQQLQRPDKIPQLCWDALLKAIAFEPQNRSQCCTELLHAFQTPEPARRTGWLNHFSSKGTQG
ncbi:serine/threonine-protein kinase [Pseudomonas segetis]